MNTLNDETATGDGTNSVGLAGRTGPGRATSANRAKIKSEDATRDALYRAASEEEARMDPANRSTRDH